jgi:hypothetical protein
MRWRWFGALAALAGCGSDELQTFCTRAGSAPFDGQTAVSTDAVIELTGAEPIPEDLPPIDDTVELRTLDGVPVPFRVEVEPRAGVVRVIPRRPLLEDQGYVVTAGEWSTLRGGNHWWGELPDGGFPVTVTRFRTGSRPRLLGAYGLDEDEVVLAFSEPIDLDTIVGRVRFAQDRSGEWDFDVVGTWEGHENLVWLAVAGEGAPADDTQGLFVSRGVATPGGVQLADDQSVRWEIDQPSEDELARFDGAPECPNVLFL